MANNRMMLICNVCFPEGKKHSSFEKWRKTVMFLGKWYPVGAYYNAPEKAWLEEFYEAHAHPETSKGVGEENPFRLEYEVINPPKIIIDVTTIDKERTE